MIEFKKPAEVAKASGIKCLIYGQPGTGKTRMCTTTGEKTLLISAEAGLLSIMGTKADVDVVEVHTFDQLGEIYQHLQGGTDYQWVCLDSVSEIAEVTLAHEMKATKHALAAYGEMATKVISMVRAFRDLPNLDVVFTAKQEKTQDDNGRLLFGPSTPGAKTAAALPYYVDLVGAMILSKDNEGVVTHWLQARGDGRFVAKDRSGCLDNYEAPDLQAIKRKILGQTLTSKAA